MLHVKILRFDPDGDAQERYDLFKVSIPQGETWTIMQVLDKISQHHDPSLAYFKHSACYHGKCRQCTVRLNHKVVLACQTIVPSTGEIQLDPVSRSRLIRDLVFQTF